MAIPMTETEIPQDIAKVVADALGPPNVRVSKGVYASTSLRVALALLSERQAATARERARCAAIADRHKEIANDLAGTAEDDLELALCKGEVFVAKSIAASIRTETGND